MPIANVFTVTFNCGRQQVRPKIFARHLSDALPDSTTPDIIILSLQELAPISYSFLGGSFLTPYFDGFRHAVRLATDSLEDVRYVNFVTRNVGMTAIMGFVRQNEIENIRSLETGGVGVGVQEMGNKGAVGLRFEYSVGEEAMELSVVAAHLAPMEGALERRNQDWKSIVQRLVFTPVGRGALPDIGEQGLHINEEDAPLLSEVPGSVAAETRLYHPTSYLIFAGDLNYRTSYITPSPSDFRTFPQPTENINDLRHFSHLLKKDQLSRELKGQRTCHGLQEANINFPPTYKYSDDQRAVADIDNGHRWDWAKHRWPSWCDRILYLDQPPWMKTQTSPASIEVHTYTAFPLMSTSDHRPVAISLSIPLLAKPTSEDEMADADVRIHAPFGIDPKWREKRQIARRKELVVGFIAYLGLTWEGNGILLATVIGALGGWAIIKSMLEV